MVSINQIYYAKVIIEFNSFHMLLIKKVLWNIRILLLQIRKR